METHSICLPDGRILSSGAGGIAIGSVRLTQTVNSGNELTPGSVCAAIAEIELMDTANTCPLQAGDEFTLLRNGQAVGIFTVETPKRIGTSRFSVTAYDRVAKLDRNLEKWLGGLTGWPYPLEEFTRMVCQACGVSARLTDLPNGVYPVQKFSVGEVTGRQLVGWAAQLMGRFCRAGADGTLDFCWYTPAERTIGPQTGEGCAGFFEGTLSYSDYTIAPVDAVTIYAGEKTLSFPDGNGENVYTVTANPYVTGTEADLPVAEHLYKLLSQMSYTPASVTVQAGLFAPGQQVYVTDAVGKVFSMPVMTAVRSGQREKLSCTGSARRERGTAQSVERLTGKVQALRTDVERLKTDGQSAALGLDVRNLFAEVTRLSHDAQVLRQALAEQLAGSQTEKTASLPTVGELETSLNPTGLRVLRKGENILRADASGVAAANLQVENHLMLGSHARFQDHGEGTGCFYL